MTKLLYRFACVCGGMIVVYSHVKQNKMGRVNLYQIANDLNQMYCEVHNKSIGAVVQEDKIVFKNPCCNEFEQEMNVEYAARVDKYLGGFVA